MKKLLVAFSNSANAPESHRLTKRPHCVCVIKCVWVGRWGYRDAVAT